jgi:hypothetical protein
LANPEVAKFVVGQSLKKFVYVRGKLANIVV